MAPGLGDAAVPPRHYLALWPALHQLLQHSSIRLPFHHPQQPTGSFHLPLSLHHERKGLLHGPGVHSPLCMVSQMVQKLHRHPVDLVHFRVTVQVLHPFYQGRTPGKAIASKLTNHFYYYNFIIVIY